MTFSSGRSPSCSSARGCVRRALQLDAKHRLLLHRPSRGQRSRIGVQLRGTSPGRPGPLAACGGMTGPGPEPEPTRRRSPGAHPRPRCAPGPLDAPRRPMRRPGSRVLAAFCVKDGRLVSPFRPGPGPPRRDCPASTRSRRCRRAARRGRGSGPNPRADTNCRSRAARSAGGCPPGLRPAP